MKFEKSKTKKSPRVGKSPALLVFELELEMELELKLKLEVIIFQLGKCCRSRIQNAVEHPRAHKVGVVLPSSDDWFGSGEGRGGAYVIAGNKGYPEGHRIVLMFRKNSQIVGES